MIINKTAIAIGKIATKNGTRPILDGVRINPKTQSVVATDSFILAEHILEHELPASDFPEVGQSEGSELSDSFVISGEEFSKVKIPKGNSPLPILGKGLLWKHDEEVHIATTDLINTQKTSFKAFAGNYPDVYTVIPENLEGRQSVIVNAKLLKKLLDVFIKASKDDEDSDFSVQLSMGSETEPILLMGAGGRNSQHTRALIMPLKGEKNTYFIKN